MHVDNNNIVALPALSSGYYNVTEAVGPAGTAFNRRDDVLLVQYLLKEIAEGGHRPVAGDWTPPGPARSFRVDGWMGSVTAAWIRSYQKACNKKGRLLFEDNRIDPARGVWASITHTVYTILAMNVDFAEVRPAKFKALEDAVDAPDELRTVIRTTRAQGIITVFPTNNSF